MLNQLLKVTLVLEADPTKVTNKMKAESLGAQNSIKVRVCFICPKVKVHTNSCSKSLRNHHYITYILTFDTFMDVLWSHSLGLHFNGLNQFFSFPYLI